MGDTRCCGCCGLRPGSIAAAVYSMIVAVLGVLYFGYNLLNMQALKQDIYNLNPDVIKYLNVEAYISAMTAENIYAVVCLSLVFIASILLILGIKKDNKTLLVPFLVTKILGYVWYLFAAILAGNFVGKVGFTEAGASYIASVVMLLPFCIADMFCYQIVWLQYKEYRSDIGLQTGTIQQMAPAATGGFGYRKMQDDAPSANGAPPTA